MSSASDNAAGRKAEKSSFAQTCNLLSQYLKEKRSLGVGVTVTSTPTPRIEPKGTLMNLNLLTNMERAEETKGYGQMTIFYGGKVVVLNDLPSERAEEIMAMAGTGKGTGTETISPSREQLLHPQPQPKAPADLPIARRASLHRFFEKRKDRVSARAPYQVNSHQYSASSKPAAHSYRFNNSDQNGNRQSSNHFDLNL